MQLTTNMYIISYLINSLTSLTEKLSEQNTSDLMNNIQQHLRPCNVFKTDDAPTISHTGGSMT